MPASSLYDLGILASRDSWIDLVILVVSCPTCRGTGIAWVETGEYTSAPCLCDCRARANHALELYDAAKEKTNDTKNR